MAKEWILNSATNRFQLNFKRNVGPTSEYIRACRPTALEEWGEYYYSKVYPKAHLVDLGKKLYVKITEVLEAEIAEITEQDCVDYILNLVFNCTYDRYVTEIRTIYGQFEECLSNSRSSPFQMCRTCHRFTKSAKSNVKPTGNSRPNLEGTCSTYFR